MWSLAGSQAIDQPIFWVEPESGKASRSATLSLCVGQLASAPGAHPLEVSGVGPQSANLGARNRCSGDRWGCSSSIHSPGAERGVVPEAAAAEESSLTIC